MIELQLFSKYWCLIRICYLNQQNSFLWRFIFLFNFRCEKKNNNNQNNKTIWNELLIDLDSSLIQQVSRVSNGLPRIRLLAVSSVDSHPPHRKSGTGNDDSWLQQDLQPRNLPMQEASLSPAANKQPHNNNSKSNKTTTTITDSTATTTTSKTTQSHIKNQKLSGVSQYWLFETMQQRLIWS